jgi:hypothetical protein
MSLPEAADETYVIDAALRDGKIGEDKVTLEKENIGPNGFWKRHLDKIGVGSSLFAALCCLGFPALVSIVSAIGLGFLINDDILRPMTIFFCWSQSWDWPSACVITTVHGH